MLNDVAIIEKEWAMTISQIAFRPRRRVL